MITHSYRGNGSDEVDSFLKTTESGFAHQINRDFWPSFIICQGQPFPLSQVLHK